MTQYFKGVVEGAECNLGFRGLGKGISQRCVSYWTLAVVDKITSTSQSQADISLVSLIEVWPSSQSSNPSTPAEP